MPSALLISLLWLGVSGEAHVEWRGGDACPGAEFEFERALDDYVGEAALGGAVAAHVTLVDAGGGGMRLTMTLESEAGREEHELRGLGCEQLIDQAALLVAGVIDPFVYAGGDRRMQHEVVPIQRPRPLTKSLAKSLAKSSPEPEPEPEFELRAADDLLPNVDRPRAPSRNRGSLGAAAISFVGLFPQIGGGAQLEGGLDRGAFRWQNSVTGYFGGRVRASESDVGANLWALAGSTGLCGVARTKWVRVPLCGVGGVGFISAQAVGTVEPNRSVRPWVHVGGEAGVSLLARPNLAIGLALGVHVSVVRPSWEVHAPDVNYTIPPVMGLLRLILEIRELGDQSARP